MISNKMNVIDTIVAVGLVQAGMKTDTGECLTNGHWGVLEFLVSFPIAGITNSTHKQSTMITYETLDVQFL